VNLTRRTAPAVVLTIALAAGIAACGSAGSARPARSGGSTGFDPLAGLSAAQIVTRAADDSNMVATMHMSMRGKLMSTQVTPADFTFVRGRGCAGTEAAPGGGSLRIITTWSNLNALRGINTWVEANKAFTKAGQYIPGAVRSMPTGIYVHVTRKDDPGGDLLRRLAYLCIDNAAPFVFDSIRELGTAGSDLRRVGPIVRIDGQRAAELTLSGAGLTDYGLTDYVSDTAKPLVLRMDAPLAAPSVVDYSAFGTPATIKPSATSRSRGRCQVRSVARPRGCRRERGQPPSQPGQPEFPCAVVRPYGTAALTVF